MLALIVGCGKGRQSGTDPSLADSPYQITISAAGAVSPHELVVPQGARVLFINLHSRSHFMSSDPHPDHEDCPPINQVGVLRPGERRETGNLIEIRTCGIHDHDDPDNLALRGAIVVR
jgi:hypothetical protein